MLEEVLDRVRSRWRNEQLILAPPMGERELLERFLTLGVNANSEILKVFSTLGGFADDDLDSECLTFWTVDKILTENQRGWVMDRSYIHFADFLIDSHTYAFRINDSALTAAVYCHWDSNYIVKICDSFEAFFDFYLFDPAKLWPN
jgi:hypothetical protein